MYSFAFLDPKRYNSNKKSLPKGFIPFREYSPSKEIPDDAAIEVLFLDLLDDLSLKREEREELEKKSIKEKWEIYHHQRIVDSQTPHPQYLIKRMSESPSINLLNQTLELLQKGRNSWVCLFFDSKGIKFLLSQVSRLAYLQTSYSKISAQSAELLTGSLKALRCCCNHQLGVTEITQYIDAIPVIIHSMIEEFPETFLPSFSILVAFLFESDQVEKCVRTILLLMKEKWKEIFTIIQVKVDKEFLRTLVSFIKGINFVLDDYQSLRCDFIFTLEKTGILTRLQEISDNFVSFQEVGLQNLLDTLRADIDGLSMVFSEPYLNPFDLDFVSNYVTESIPDRPYHFNSLILQLLSISINQRKQLEPILIFMHNFLIVERVLLAKGDITSMKQAIEVATG